MNQEWIAFALVVAAGFWLFSRFFRKYLRGPLSEFFLKYGKVKWAMRVRHGFWPKKTGKTGKTGKGGDCCG